MCTCYVIIVRKYCHELGGNVATLKVVSLKTGEQFSEEFFGPTSGIRNLQFRGWEKSSTNSGQMLYTIDERNHKVIESNLPDESHEISLNLPNANYMDWYKYEPALIKNPKFYKLDKSYIEYMETKKQLEILSNEDNFPPNN